MTAPHPQQIREFLADALAAVHPHWDRDPLIAAVYLPAAGSITPRGLGWTPLPVHTGAWTSGDQMHEVIGKLAATMATREGIYTLSALDSWDRWCGVAAIFEAFLATAGDPGPRGHERALTRERVHVVAALTTTTTAAGAGLRIWVTVRGEHTEEMVCDREHDHYRAGDDGGLIGGLAQLATALGDARDRILAAGLGATTHP